MATIDDVEQGVCNALAGVMFPGQVYQFGAVATCAAPWLGYGGAPSISISAKLYVGEPPSVPLETDIIAGVSNIGVMRILGATRNVTTFAPRWQQVSKNVAPLSVALLSGSVVFGGNGGAGMTCGVTAGDVCYAYRPVLTDTPASVAAALAALIPGGSAVGAILSGPNITAAVVLPDQAAFLATGQQETLLQVTILAVPVPGSPAPLATGKQVRASLTRLVGGLKTMLRQDGTVNRFIGLPDGTSARLIQMDERDDDTTRRNDVWRRWVTFRCMYDEGVAQIQPALVAPLLIMNTGAGQVLWAGNGFPVSNVLTDGAGNVLADAAGNMLGGR